MTTFSDTFSIRSDQGSFSQIALALDSLVVDYAYDIESTLINTNSTSYVDYTNLTTSITTETGQSLLILLNAKITASTAGQYANISINYDSSDVKTGTYREPTGSTSGNTGHISIFHFIAAPTPGAHTIKARWLSSSGAVTVYSAEASIVAFAFRTS